MATNNKSSALQNEVRAEIEKHLAQDKVGLRTTSGAMTTAQREWLANGGSRTYALPQQTRRREVDPSMEAILLEYRRISTPVDRKKLRDLINLMRRQGMTNPQIAEAIEKAKQAGELVSDESVTFLRQHEANVQLANVDGFNLDNPHYVFEESVSGYKRKHRPQFTAMMKFIENFEGANPIYLYIFEISRLIRNVEVANTTMSTLMQKSVNLRIATHPYLDISNELAEIVMPLLIRFAHNEAKMTSIRIAGSHNTRSKVGSVRTSTPPLGLTTKKAKTEIGERSMFTPNEAPRPDYPGKKSEAWLVREIFSRYAAGDSATQIVQWLNDSGFPPVKANCWYENTIMRMIRNPHYVGYIRYNPADKNGKTLPLRKVDEQIVRNEDGTPLIAHEGIIAKDVWDVVQAKAKLQYKPRGPQRTLHRLSGILVCARCESKMFGQANAGKSRSYRCPHSYKNSKDDKTIDAGTQVKERKCVANNMIADGIEAVIYRLARTIVANPVVRDSITVRPIVDVTVNQAELDEVMAEIREYQELLDKETRDSARKGHATALADATAKMERINARSYANIANATKALGSVEEFDDMWSNGNKSATVMALSGLIDKVVVAPNDGTRMNHQALAKNGWLCDYSRITIHWMNGDVTNVADAFYNGNAVLVA
jgi:DNA invertase Pin-like site-specific DNA recombinase